jgi:hypothetical protein
LPGTPLPYMQQVLDTALERPSEEVKARFAEGVLLTQRDEPVVARQEDAVSAVGIQPDGPLWRHRAPAQWVSGGFRDHWIRHA